MVSDDTPQRRSKWTDWHAPLHTGSYDVYCETGWRAGQSGSQRQRSSRKTIEIINKNKIGCPVTNFLAVYTLRKISLRTRQAHQSKAYHLVRVMDCTRGAFEHNDQKLTTTKGRKVEHNNGCGSGQISSSPVLLSGSTVLDLRVIYWHQLLWGLVVLNVIPGDLQPAVNRKLSTW